MSHTANNSHKSHEQRLIAVDSRKIENAIGVIIVQLLRNGDTFQNSISNLDIDDRIKNDLISRFDATIKAPARLLISDLRKIVSSSEDISTNNNGE